MQKARAAQATATVAATATAAAPAAAAAAAAAKSIHELVDGRVTRSRRRSRRPLSSIPAGFSYRHEEVNHDWDRQQADLLIGGLRIFDMKFFPYLV